MKTWHKGLIIGGVSLAVLVPAGLVAADQIGPGSMHGRGNGSMDRDCDRDQMQAQMQARDGSGPMHAANSIGRMNGTGRMNGSGGMNGNGWATTTTTTTP